MIPQWLGMFGLTIQLVVALVYKIVTGEYAAEPALLTAFGGLIVLGQGKEALNSLRAPDRVIPSEDGAESPGPIASTGEAVPAPESEG